MVSHYGCIDEEDVGEKKIVHGAEESCRRGRRFGEDG